MPAPTGGFGSRGRKKSSGDGGAGGFAASAAVPLKLRITFPCASRKSIVIFCAGCFTA